jgi:hypothetical protein
MELVWGAVTFIRGYPASENEIWSFLLLFFVAGSSLFVYLSGVLFF